MKFTRVKTLPIYNKSGNLPIKSQVVRAQWLAKKNSARRENLVSESKPVNKVPQVTALLQPGIFCYSFYNPWQMLKQPSLKSLGLHILVI